jgi:hypothetical protein
MRQAAAMAHARGVLASADLTRVDAALDALGRG